MGKSKQQRVEQTPDEVLFIFGAPQLAGPVAVPASSVQLPMQEGEIAIKEHLEELGYTVALVSDAEFKDRHTAGKSVVIISSTVDPYRVGDTLRRSETPIIVSNSQLFTIMGMTTGTGAGGRSSYGTAAHDAPVTICDSEHPMAAGLTGTIILSNVVPGLLTKPVEKAVERFSKLLKPVRGAGESTAREGDGRALIWGTPVASATKIAVLMDHTERVVVFGYELCAKMVGLYAPARRVGLFLDQETATSLTSEGWALFDAAVRWAIGDEAQQFPYVFKVEWQEIQYRRGSDSQTRRATDNCQPPDNLVGLALSGGGIRSATFCLGVLQGLHELKFLRVFDYLSTVSGGGYLGGWWSAWLSRENSTGKDIFPPEEEIELDRAHTYHLAEEPEEEAEDARSVEKDSIHHLRLFANYLTPRKGLLSADTWRAISIITRNLILTWLILLPILMAFVLVGQLYFVLQPHSPREFAFPFRSEIAKINMQREGLEETLKLEREKKYPGDASQAARREEELSKEINKKLMDARGLEAAHEQVLRKRAKIAALPIIPLTGWIIYMTGLWMMRNTGGSRKLAWTGGITVWLLLGITSFIYNRDSLISVWDTFQHSPSDTWTTIVSEGWLVGILLILVWVVVAALLWFYACRKGLQDKNYKTASDEDRKQVQINRIVRLHVRLLVILVVTAAVLALGGFGHELVEYIFQPGHGLIVQAGGWTAIASAIAGSIFTAVKGSPMGGGDTRTSSTPSLLTRIIFAVTPPLVLIVLALAAAWAARWALYYIIPRYISCIPPLTLASFVGVTLWLIFASAEINWRRATSVRRRLIISGVVIGAVVVEHVLLSKHIGWLHTRILPLAVISLVSGFVLLRLLVTTGIPGAGIERQRIFKFVIFREKFKDYPVTVSRLIWLSLTLSMLVGACIAVGVRVFGSAGWRSLIRELPANRIWTSCAAMAGLLLCMVLLLLEIRRGKGRNRRAISLFLAAYLVLTGLLVTSFFDDYKVYTSVLLIHAAIGLLAIVFGWVVALGWMADPNALSLHTFYKGRLVRAYMGASNPKRSEQREITNAVKGDDILLKDLQNCQRGAPYHLINTTLNLVGGRDLTTAQRSSAAFVLSKRYCGSSRTWYRKTDKYMDGALFLGAAVAASGAAVSPNMGSLRTSASLAMLMTLLNVRLGYWAPTPNKDNWRLSQTRLWPFYMLRESLSQTTDLSTYCYLTDGGHFENTGLYSLVERGCRYIVLVDSAADPAPCFADLGNAIRRCRIDFKTEIALDITSFIKKSKEDRFASHHYAVGQIKYDEGHLKKLGWIDTSPEKLTGVIVYIKPALLKEDKDLTPDVRQYEIENEGFPQQTTADQWFDEAQFESYRQLGYHCATSAFGKLEFDHNCAYQEALKKERQGTTLLPEEKILIEAKQASDHIRSGQFAPGDIEKAFNFFYAFMPQ